MNWRENDVGSFKEREMLGTFLFSSLFLSFL